MTQKQFNKQLTKSLQTVVVNEITRLRRRIERLKLVESGDATIKRVYRNGYKVKAHTVAGHYMHLVRKVA